MKTDPIDLPVVRIVLTLPDGEELTREWTLRDGPPRPPDPPAWTHGRTRAWAHPQDPITIAAYVDAGHEAEARAWIAELGA
jgi:hypothetical protein